MVREHLLDRFSEADLLSQSFRVYTTLDPELQRAASEGVDAGAKNVDAQLAKRYARWRKEGQEPPQAQVGDCRSRSTQWGDQSIDRRTGLTARASSTISSRGGSQGLHSRPFVYAAAFEGAWTAYNLS